MIDQLTKIYNRRFFFEISEKELRKAVRDESNICVAMLDIDRFKMVNDTYGHLEGDNVLTALAKLIGDVIRDKDIFARFGGEEFVLLMPQTNSEEVKSILERIRKEVEAFDFSPIEKLTISIGFAKVDTSKRLEKSIDRADEALYMAKNL
jgi:diguanylate cyclase (GGDEF)-like protein